MGAAPAEAISLVRTSLRGNCCSWQFRAVICNTSLGSLEISLYNIANIFLSGIGLCRHRHKHTHTHPDTHSVLDQT